MPRQYCQQYGGQSRHQARRQKAHLHLHSTARYAGGSAFTPSPAVASASVCRSRVAVLRYRESRQDRACWRVSAKTDRRPAACGLARAIPLRSRSDTAVWASAGWVGACVHKQTGGPDDGRAGRLDPVQSFRWRIPGPWLPALALRLFTLAALAAAKGYALSGSVRNAFPFRAS